MVWLWEIWILAIYISACSWQDTLKSGIWKYVRIYFLPTPNFIPTDLRACTSIYEKYLFFVMESCCLLSLIHCFWRDLTLTHSFVSFNNILQVALYNVWVPRKKVPEDQLISPSQKVVCMIVFVLHLYRPVFGDVIPNHSITSFDHGTR